MLLELVAGPAVAYLAWSFFCLEMNVRRARAMNVPVVRLPVDCNNIPWVVFSPWLFKFLDKLPIPWSKYPDAIRYSRRGWHFQDSSQTHVRLGPVWALVTPVTIYLHFSDPDALDNIFARRKDFVRPIKEYQLLEVYGPCLSTAGSDDWPRHRKVLAAPFNEGIMSFVWEESIRQAESMLHAWTDASEAGVLSVQRDLRTLALNILASIGLRKSYPFKAYQDPSASQKSSHVVDEANTYRDSLQTVLDNCITLMIFPYRYLTLPWVPEKFQKIGRASLTFKHHMQKMIDDETETVRQGKAGSGGLMTGFVHALEVHKRESAANVPMHEKKGLSIDEVFGNLFVINFAGHDTTANTLAFATLLLTSHPEVQDWVSEEIKFVTGPLPADKWDYKAIYPQLKRCRAVMLETLRLYPPIMAIPKWTKNTPQVLRLGDQVLQIPKGTGTIPSLYATQTHPDHWPEPLRWLPKRWILNPAPSKPSLESPGIIAREELLVPHKLIYFPWSAGPMSCPGQKLSEVEFAATIACLLKSHRLSAKQEQGETKQATLERVKIITNDVNMEMLLRMQNADRVRVICRRV